MGYRSVIPAVIGRLLNSKKFGYDKDIRQDKEWEAETQPDGPLSLEENSGQDIDEHTWQEKPSGKHGAPQQSEKNGKFTSTQTGDPHGPRQ